MIALLDTTDSEVKISRLALAAALDGPGETLVIDGLALNPRMRRAERIASAMPLLSMGKNSIVYRTEMAAVAVEFVQGVKTGGIDPTVLVCVNSLVCGFAISEHVWNLKMARGWQPVTMGDERFEILSVGQVAS